MIGLGSVIGSPLTGPMLGIAGAVAAVVLVASNAGTWAVRGWMADRDIAQLQVEHGKVLKRNADAVLVQLEDARKAQAAEAALAARRTQLIGEIVDGVTLETQRLATLDRAVGVRAGSLRAAASQAAAAADRACPAAQSAASSPAASTPAGVLAFVLEQASERSRILARAADESRTAGNACVGSFESLTPP